MILASRRLLSWALLAPALALTLPACEPEESDDNEVEIALYSVAPNIAGQGTSLTATLNATASRMVFGGTELDLGDGLTVTSLTVHDGFTATATITVDPNAELGPRDAVITVEGRSPTTVEDALEIVAESIRIEPDSARLGETLAVQVLGTDTLFEDGYTWANFGPGIDILDVSVLSESLAEVTIAVPNTATPGLRDVRMESGPDVVTLFGGFTVDRAALAAEFDPSSAFQGQTIEFTVRGLDTAWGDDTVLEFWDASGYNGDIVVQALTIANGETLYGQLTVSNAAEVGFRDVLIESGGETLVIPDAFEVFDADPDLSRVYVGTGFDVERVWDNDSGEIAERVSAIAYFLIPLDPPCGSSPQGSGPSPYDVNGVFESPPDPEPVDCPNPETVSAGDVVWFESGSNVVTLEKEVIQSTGQIIYVGRDLTLDDYRFGQFYDLHTQGDDDGIPEVLLEGVQPTVPADFQVLSPQLHSDYVHDRAQDFVYTWTPAQTYPDAFFTTSISGTLAATGRSGFVGALPWDDGEHTYSAAELAQLQTGQVTFSASSAIEGPYFGLPFSVYQTCQSDSVLSLTASLSLE